MPLNRRVDWLLVKDAVSDETVEFLIDLIQQRRHLRRILLVTFGDSEGDNLPLIIDTNVQLLSAFALLLPVFLAVPFPLATNL